MSCTTLDDIFIWIFGNPKAEKTGNKCEGTEIYSFEIEKDAKIMVESFIPMTLGDLQQMKGIVEKGSGRTMAVFQKSKNTKGKPTVGALLIGAFELGWHIGTKIDEGTDLSDKVSDWLAEKFP